MKNVILVLSLFLITSSCKKDELKIKLEPIACFDYTPTNDLKVGDTLKFLNCSMNSNIYSWDFGDGNTSNDSTPYHSFRNAGSYTIWLFASMDNITDTISKTIEINTNQVLAGIINKNMLHDTFTPEFLIDYVWNNCGYGSGKDSIDFQKDGIYDIRLTAKFLDYPAFLNCCGNADCFPSGLRYNLLSLNNVGVATYNEPYDNFYFTFADTLNAGYRIDTINIWGNRTDLWCNDYPYPYQGSWFHIKNDKYLAIRLGDSGDFKYGWIKIGTNSEHNLIFKEYAIEK